MLSKLSIFLVSGAALLTWVIAVPGQDERPSAPWPFGKSLNPLHWPSAGNSNAESNANASPTGTVDANSPNQQPTHSAPVQSDSNRRLYGPSLAVRPGVANGYAPQTSVAPRFVPAPQLNGGDAKLVITPGNIVVGDSLPGASPRDPAVIGPSANSSNVRNSMSGGSSRNSAAASALSQDLQSADATPRDTRSLQERLAAIRQSADKDPPTSAIANVATAAPIAPAARVGRSSRRVIESANDGDDASTATTLSDHAHDGSARLAAPYKAASIDSTSRTEAASEPSPVKPAQPDVATKSDVADMLETAARAEVAKLDPIKPDPIKPDPFKQETTKFDQAKAELAPAPRGRASSRAANRDVADSEDKPSPSGALLFTRQSPLVSVETTGPRTIVIGKEATYVVTIKNSGDVGAQDLAVTVKVPEWTDVAGAQASVGTTRVAAADANEPFQWKIPRLEAHGKETLSLRLLPRKGRGFDLAVQWTFTPISSQTVVDVQEPKLNMTIAGPDEVVFGQSKLYRLTISNPGTGDAENVIVQLDPIGNSSAPPSKHPIGTIHAGDSKVVELELTARQTGTISIRAGANADPGLRAEAAQEVLVRRAAVALAVEGSKTKYAGTIAGYSIRLTNPGNSTAENVRVYATLPPGAKFVSASAGGQWKADQGKVAWSLPALRSGGESAVELKCTLANPGPNRLQIASSAAGDVSDAANITTNVEALADLKLDVSEPAGPIGVGDEVVYELRVRNRGSKAAEAVGVVAYFSEGIEPVSAQGSANDISNGVVAFRPLPTVAAGGEVTLKIKARAERSGKQVFRAEVECGALGTKLVTAQEMTVYSSDGTPGLERADRALAGRNPPLKSMPSRPDDGPPKPLRR
jgi:uncharacterized repeat protein (TIGR01451 family)